MQDGLISTSARAIYNQALAGIAEENEKYEAENHQDESELKECILCSHNIPGIDYKSANLKYTELLLQGESPTGHMENMHEACVDYLITTTSLCPLCREEILLK